MVKIELAIKGGIAITPYFRYFMCMCDTTSEQVYRDGHPRLE